MSQENCPTIIGLKLDQGSLNGIKYIRNLTEGLDFVGKAIMFSSVIDIFTSRNVPTAAFNIYQTEWELLTEVMVGIPRIQRDRIVLVASEQELRHFKDPKQKKFWRAVRHGCSI